MDWLFHMTYNVDYFLAVIPVQVILIIYYMSRRHLPLRESESFLRLMLLNLGTLVSDVVSIICIDREAGPAAIYVFSILYFTFLLFTIAGLLIYTSDALHVPDFAGKWTVAVLLLPAWVMLFFLFTTPWTGFFFQSTAEIPYRNGPVYPGIDICYGFYLGCSLFLILYHWKRNTVRRNISFLTCTAFLVAGVLYHNFDHHTEVTGFFMTLAIFIAYLTVRNPELYTNDETGLLNKGALDLVIQDRRRRGDTHGFGFLIKGYDQSRILYGGLFIDSFLEMIGKFLQKELPRCQGFYLRNGRFIVLTDTESQIKGAAEKIKKRFHEPWTSGKRVAVFDISFVFADDNLPFPSMDEFNQVLRDSFKEAGKISVDAVTVDRSYVEMEKRKFHVRRVLRDALDRDSLCVYLQPLMDGKNWQPVGAEVLVRLKDTDGTIINPDEFVPVAEENGSIALLGLEVFGRACRLIHKGLLERCGLRWLHVNVSPLQCLDSGLPEKFEALRHEYHVPLQALRLELTEQAALGSIGSQQAQKLEKLGYAIILDDYGNGHSNAGRLKSFHVTGLKLDNRFVEHYMKQPDLYIRNLVQGTRASGYEVTAEGIDTEKAAEVFSKMGCNWLQGFYFSRPLPVEEFIGKYGKK